MRSGECGPIHEEHALREPQRGRVDATCREARDHCHVDWLDIGITSDGALGACGVDRREWLHAVIRGEHNDDTRRIAQLEQGVEKDSQIAVESKDLIVLFARIGAERVPHGIGGGERDRKQVRLRTAAEFECREPGERRL